MKKLLIITALLFLCPAISSGQWGGGDGSEILETVTEIEATLDDVLEDTGTTLPADHVTITSETDKIDNAETDGLNGVHNSLAYRVHEIEKHFHNRERWYGLHTSIDPGVNEGEQGSILPFVSVIGTGETWGDWIPILGSGDTPAISGMVKFDLHRIEITDVVNAGSDPNKHVHFIQIAHGATGAAGFASGDYTEVIITPEKDGKQSPVDVMMPRHDAGALFFLRHRVVNRDTQADIDECTMEFYFGIHEYPGN